MRKVLVVVGPTSIGKSSLGVELAIQYNGEIISGDSVQVYKGLDIGSAKITHEETKGVKHYLIDQLNLSEEYSVYDFQKTGRQLIEQVSTNNKLPIVVGGTGLYIKALLYDYVFNEEVNTDVSKYEEYSNQELYDLLLTRDADSLKTIHVNNRKRLIRALVLSDSGISKTDNINAQSNEPIYDILIIGLTMSREKLYSRINQRVDLMFEQGLITEVKDLYHNNPNLFELQSLQGIGYKEWKDYFEDQAELDDIKQLIQRNTRRFAKRQYTWFNNQLPVKWFDIENENYKCEISEVITRWIND